MSIECILPPYMLTRIAEQGTPAQRNWAEQTLIVSQQIREDRAAATDATVSTSEVTA